MSKQFKISIIIPVYNVQQYIDRCMESIVPQLDSDVEVILIDDGSTDNSLDICKKYEYDDRIVVAHKTNGGLASARNYGLEMAKGEYITFLDSDDWLSNGTLLEFRRIIKEYQPDIIGYGFQKVTDTEVIQKKEQYWREGIYSGEKMHDIVLDFVSCIIPFEYRIIRSSCMHVFKKELIEESKIRFISERVILNEDYLFIMSAVKRAKSYYCSKMTNYQYFTRSNSLTTSYKENMFERKKNLYQAYLGLFDSRNEDLERRLDIFYLNNSYECLLNENQGEKMALIFNDEHLQRIIRNLNNQYLSVKGLLIVVAIRLKSPFVFKFVRMLIRIGKRLR